jgi:hypothetical protein
MVIARSLEISPWRSNPGAAGNENVDLHCSFTALLGDPKQDGREPQCRGSSVRAQCASDNGWLRSSFSLQRIAPALMLGPVESNARQDPLSSRPFLSSRACEGSHADEIGCMRSLVARTLASLGMTVGEMQVHLGMVDGAADRPSCNPLYLKVAPLIVDWAHSVSTRVLHDSSVGVICYFSVTPDPFTGNPRRHPPDRATSGTAGQVFSSAV